SPNRSGTVNPAVGRVGGSYLDRLQRSIGNQAVIRLIQRYAVPGGLACDDVVPWLGGHSPYAPEWAETRSNYELVGSPRVAVTSDDGTFTAHAKGYNGLAIRV